MGSVLRKRDDRARAGRPGRLAVAGHVLDPRTDLCQVVCMYLGADEGSQESEAHKEPDEHASSQSEHYSPSLWWKTMRVHYATLCQVLQYAKRRTRQKSGMSDRFTHF